MSKGWTKASDKGLGQWPQEGQCQGLMEQHSGGGRWQNEPPRSRGESQSGGALKFQKQLRRRFIRDRESEHFLVQITGSKVTEKP